MALVGSILGSREPSLLHDDKRMDKKSCAVSNVDFRQTCPWMCHVVIWYGSNRIVPALWVFYALGILNDVVRRVALNNWLSAACLEWKRGATGQLGSAKIKETTTIISESLCDAKTCKNKGGLWLWVMRMWLLMMMMSFCIVLLVVLLLMIIWLLYHVLSVSLLYTMYTYYHRDHHFIFYGYSMFTIYRSIM